MCASVHRHLSLLLSLSLSLSIYIYSCSLSLSVYLSIYRSIYLYIYTRECIFSAVIQPTFIIEYLFILMESSLVSIVNLIKTYFKRKLFKCIHWWSNYFDCNVRKVFWDVFTEVAQTYLLHHSQTFIDKSMQQNAHS